MINFQVDEDLCTQCGDCVRDCRLEILELDKNNYPRIRQERDAFCIQCQHCLAVCPTAALSIHNKNPKNSLEFGEAVGLDFGQMKLLIQKRRSIRQYENANVDQLILKDILSALSNVPTGGNNHKLTFVVIDNIQTMKSFLQRATSLLSETVRKGEKPDDWFIANAAPLFLQNGPDTIFHGAPHLLIGCSPLSIYTAREDVIISLAYFELLAQSAGLGTVWFGMGKSMLEAVPELKRMINLPENTFYYPLLFGYPAVSYHRSVQRDDAIRINRVDL